MKFLGKLIGGTIGLIVGGPIGAGIGTGIGSLFDGDDKENNLEDTETLKMKEYRKQGGDEKNTKPSYNTPEYDKDGYDREGYDKDGYDREGHDKAGYDREGFKNIRITDSKISISADSRITLLDRLYFKQYNEDRLNLYKDTTDFYKRTVHVATMKNLQILKLDTMDISKLFFVINYIEPIEDDKGRVKAIGRIYRRGYNKDGYNKDGYNKDGYNKDGYNKDGYNKYGYNKEGYDKNGYDREGYNKEGYDKNGYDRAGYIGENLNIEINNTKVFTQIEVSKDNRENYNHNKIYENTNSNMKDLEKIYKEGLRYAIGDGVPQNLKKSVEYYIKAAENGHLKAQCNLGYCYEFGKGVTKNLVEAVKWYTKAAKGGNEEAQCNLGYCYINGKGISTNIYEGIIWITKAAEKGYARGQYNLGYCYEKGIGKVKSRDEAINFYQKASSQGHKQAIIRLKELIKEREKLEDLEYDKQEFNKQGYNKDGYNKDGYNKEGYNREGYNKEGYDKHGFNQLGYNKDGYDKEGYNREGYNKEGYDKHGFNQLGYNKDGYDKEGYNREGYNKEGYDKHGFNQLGYNKDGYDKEGYNRERYNKEGYDKHGFNQLGYNKDGYNKEGYDKDGEYIYALKVGQKVYHKDYGEGVFKQLLQESKLIIIRFQDGEWRRFTYPDSMGKYIYIEKPIELIEREELLKDKEKVEEIEHFKRVFNIINKKFKVVEDVCEGYKLGYNDFSDSYDPNINRKFQLAYQDKMYLIRLKDEPFFARIDYKQKKGLYIGKNRIENEVIEWTNPICSLYYQYKIYIGNEKYDLSLVRDFQIRNEKYMGFTNKYVKNNNLDNDNLITDPQLLMIISANKDNKKVHDIISTIQANQYNIITSNASDNIIILGCAGSGKTMIMLHRLKYLISNEKNMDITDVFFVSPTNLLNLENSELAKILKIEYANKMSTIQFYCYLLKEYSTKGYKYSTEYFENITLNTSIKKKDIQDIYTEDFIKKIISNVNILLKNKPSLDKKIFILSKEKDLINKFKVLGYTGQISNLDEILNEYEVLNECIPLYKEAIKAFTLISVKNVKEILKTYGNSDNEKNKKCILEYLYLNYEFTGRTVYKGTSNHEYIDPSDKNIIPIYKLFNKKIQNKYVSSNMPWKNNNELDPIQLLKKYIPLYEEIEQYKRYINGNVQDYLYEVVEYVIKKEKDNKGITDRTYEFELFIHCYVCNYLFGPLTQKPLNIYIDEFQDYSYIELDLYFKIFPKAIFNYYGDFKQCINNKGIKSIKSLKDLDSLFKKYSINENYRNAYEITEYVNSRFSINMTPIGISGEVTQLKFEEDTFIQSVDDRIALIIKDDYKIPSFIIDNEKFNIIRYYTDEIIRGKINVIPVSLVKGLEFERVYVYFKGMTKNEQYVACTRALSELVIVDF